MDFKQLESFVAVVDEGSFSNAAERLQLSQSMVTIHIRNLEAELDNRIAEFRERMPQATFHITVCYNSEMHGKLQDGGYEFAFCNAKIMNSDFAVRHYDSSSLVIVTPNEPRFRVMKETGLTKDLFATEPMITRSSTSALQQEFLRWIKQNRPDTKLNVVTSIDDTETIKKLVGAGQGISVMSEVAVREMEADGRVRTLRLEGGICISFISSSIRPMRLLRSVTIFWDVLPAAKMMIDIPEYIC